MLDTFYLTYSTDETRYTNLHIFPIKKMFLNENKLVSYRAFLLAFFQIYEVEVYIPHYTMAKREEGSFKECWKGA